MTTWVLLAHRAGARVFMRAQDGKLELIQSIDHPEGRLRDGDVDSDRPGFSFESGRPGGRGLRRSETPQDHVAVVFAKKLADILRSARVDHAYDDLAIIAAPAFLGLIRAALDPPTAALVSKEVAKDLASVPDHDAETRVTTLLG